MILKVGIGLTTYEDVRSHDFGLAFYNALVECSPKLAPYRVDVINEKYDVEGAVDFASRWCSERRLVVRAKCGTAPSYVAPSDFGADWRTKGAISGAGAVSFGSYDPNDPSTLMLEHNYRVSPDWRGLFDSLVRIFRPAHANLHIFTKRELELAGEGRFAFREPITGEGAFTHWKTASGAWHGPDRWQVAERRQYRFLPELAWGNFLGNNFTGRFDRDQLLERSNAPVEINDGLLFQLTDSLNDVVKQPAHFESERIRLRTIFADDFFRSD